MLRVEFIKGDSKLTQDWNQTKNKIFSLSIVI